MFRILAVNPGSTSTKIAVYEDEELLFSENIVHEASKLSYFDRIADQHDFRLELILECLHAKSVSLPELSAVVGRGGLLPPVQSGAYEVNDAMLDFLSARREHEHASDLGALLAASIARPAALPAYIYDSVSADEMEPIAKISGLSDIRRNYQGHKLNVRAAAIKHAAKIGKRFEDCRFIAAHLGGGISVSFIKDGRVADLISDDEGPFSPERTGGLPMYELIHKMAGERLSEQEMMKICSSKGGLVSHLGTSNCIEVEEMIKSENEYAELVYDAMAYSVSKAIGQFIGVSRGKCDAIIITGGIARSELFVSLIKGYIDFFFPVAVMPGEIEMEALALGALRVLRGEETARVFGAEMDDQF